LPGIAFCPAIALARQLLLLKCSSGGEAEAGNSQNEAFQKRDRVALIETESPPAGTFRQVSQLQIRIEQLCWPEVSPESP